MNFNKSPKLRLNGLSISYFLPVFMFFLTNYTVFSQNITTYAGGANSFNTALNTSLSNPTNMAVDQNGNLYFSEAGKNRIRKIDFETNTIRTIVGNGNIGFDGDNLPAILSAIGIPGGIAFDQDNNLIFADQTNNRIRKVDAITGLISTIAGNGVFGFSGDNGPAVDAQLSNPVDIVINDQGDVFFSDLLNRRVRKIDAITGVITTIAGNGSAGFSGDGVAATQTAITSPYGLDLDKDNNLYIADQFNNRVRKVDALSGIITTVAGNGEFGLVAQNVQATTTAFNSPSDVKVDSEGNLWITDVLTHLVRKISVDGVANTIAGIGAPGFLGDGLPAVQAALNNPNEILILPSGNLLIADAFNNRLREITSENGIIQTFAGNGSVCFGGDEELATSATLNFPSGLDTDANNNLFFADTENHRIRMINSETNIITTIAGTDFFGFSGDGGQASNALFNAPIDVALDQSDNVYIVDRGNNRVRKIDALTGIIQTIAGNGLNSFSGDGGVAVEASLNEPTAVVIDQLGNLFIADEANNRVRRIDANTGIISTLAGNGSFESSGDDGPANQASLEAPKGLALDQNADNLFIATGNLIRKVDLNTGIITTIAGTGDFNSNGDGGLASKAALKAPYDLVIDSNGNIFIAELARIRKIDAFTNTINTVVGDGNQGFSGDNGPAIQALIGGSIHLALDNENNLFLGDRENDRIRRVGKTNEPLIQVAQNNRILINQETIDFGLTGIGETQTIEIIISNLGSSNLDLINNTGSLININQDTDNVFSLDLTNTSASIAPGESTSFLIRFLPLDDINSSATVEINSNAQNQPDFRLNIQGRGQSTIIVSRLVLVDALSGQEIMTLEDGSNINLESIDAKQLTIQAITTPQKVGSVKLELTGTMTNSRIENFGPYLLFGENFDKSFIGKIFQAGDYQIHAIPYTQADLTGVEGISLDLNFTLTGQTLPEISEVFLVDAATDEVIQKIEDDAVINLDELGIEKINILAMTNPNKLGHVEMILQGASNHSQTERILPYALFGDDPVGDFNGETLCAGAYTLMITPFLQDNTKGETLEINFEIIKSFKIQNLELINAANNTVISQLFDNQVIDLAQTGINLSVRANVDCSESVQFILKDQTNQVLFSLVENQEPYYLFADINGFPNAWQPLPGDYHLEVIPFSENQTNGLQGEPLKVSFTIIDSETITLEKVFPNPILSNSIDLELSRDISYPVEVSLYDFQGNLKSKKIFEMKNQHQIHWNLNSKALPQGIYHLKIQIPGMLSENHMILKN